MFTNLIESESHVREFKRRSSFFLITVAAYALILSGAGIASIYAYDARLEAQTTSLELLNWVPPVAPETPRPIRENHPPLVRRTASNAPIDRTATRPERTDLVSRPDNPTKVPDNVGVTGSSVPVMTEGAVLSTRNVDPPPATSNNADTCATCNSTPAVVRVVETPPPPPPPKPTTETVPTRLLISKAISLPQPLYPALAKQARVQGPVNIQILIDEQGKVISAHSVVGHPLLTNAARDAAMRARFTPTMLNGQPVKVQGVITYNFVLQ
jgi:protein TonB